MHLWECISAYSALSVCYMCVVVCISKAGVACGFFGGGD